VGPLILKGEHVTDQFDAHTDRPGLKGRRAVVTGGTTGIGRAIAVLLASEGVRVFVCGRDADHLADALKRIREVGEGSGVALDVAVPDDLNRFFAEAEAYLGGLDIAVINAAISAEGLASMSEAEVRYAIATDFTAYLVSAHAAQVAMATNRDKAGDIVLIGSMSAHVLGSGSTVYAGSRPASRGSPRRSGVNLAPRASRYRWSSPARRAPICNIPTSLPRNSAR
jgi:NAD(P)-dependent dehydrogenase (short-subunit alcohol dehydrogenase family)